MRKSCRGDPEVVTSDYFAPRRESGPDLRVHTRDGLRDRNGLELRKQMLNVSAASRPSGTAGAMNPVQQLAHRDHADRPLFVADDFVDHGTRALTGDEQVGIDQDGQGLSGGPTSARIARRSSAKSGSSGGAASRSSRNCAALTSRILGGAITATDAPARVTSISSPAETRLRTSENRRATSVALSRAIHMTVSD